MEEMEKTEKETIALFACLVTLWLLALTILMAACFAFLTWTDPPKKSEPRVINVCVFNDQKRPLKAEKIREIFSMVSDEYQKRVDIVFKIDNILFFKSIVCLSNSESARCLDKQIEYFKSVCPKSEIKIILTSSPYENPLGIVGLTWVHNGIITIYDAEALIARKTFDKRPLMAAVLMHEIGHLFGLLHEYDVSSFMAPCIGDLSYCWTEEIIFKIKRNKNQRW